MNKVEIGGTVTELGALRFTPAGLATVQFTLRHQSEQDEAGGRRQVELEIGAVAFETQARLIAGTKLNTEVKLKGFLAARSKRSKKPVLHVTDIEFKEGG